MLAMDLRSPMKYLFNLVIHTYKSIALYTYDLVNPSNNIFIGNHLLKNLNPFR